MEREKSTPWPGPEPWSKAISETDVDANKYMYITRRSEECSEVCLRVLHHDGKVYLRLLHSVMGKSTSMFFTEMNFLLASPFTSEAAT